MCRMSFCRSKKATIVEDPSLRPKGDFNVSDDVYAKAKELVLDGTIAPFEDGIDSDETSDLDTCSICYLGFPALNLTKCCGNGICSNCFFCVKTSRYEREEVPSTKPKKLRHLLLANCPYCKSKPFEICFTGAKSIEEKQREREEALRVEEALRRKREEDGKQTCTSGPEHHQWRESSFHVSSTESTSGPLSAGSDSEDTVYPEAASRALIVKHKATALEGAFSLVPGQDGELGTQRVAVDRLMLNQAILESMNRTQIENTARTAEARDQQSRTSSGSQRTPSIGGFDLMNPFVTTVDLAS